jgi:hypothetical protein
MRIQDARARRAAKLAIVLLLLIGTIWPIAELGPRGPTVLAITPDHGVDLNDIAALVLIAGAVLLTVSLRR